MLQGGEDFDNKHIDGKCLSHEFFLPCRQDEKGLKINGKYVPYNVLGVVIIKGQHQFILTHKPIPPPK